MAGGPQYGHLAAWQAGLVVRSALLGLPVRADMSLVPNVVGTDPEIAEVGLTEAAARARHGDRFTVVRAAYADNDRARVTRTTYGVAKLFVDPGGRILGAGVVGDRAGELAALFAYALANGQTVQSFMRFVPRIRAFPRSPGSSPRNIRAPAVLLLCCSGSPRSSASFPEPIAAQLEAPRVCG